MHRYIFLLLLATIPLGSHAQKKKNLKAYLDSKQFYAPGVGNYVEFNLQFAGYSLNYVGAEGGLIGEVAVMMQLSKNGETVASDAYRLSSPLMKDSIVEDFYDVKRFQLEPGRYSFYISLQDVNGEKEPMEATQTIHVEELGDAISISDIAVAEVAAISTDPTSVFYKSGYDVIPRISTFYPEQLNTIPVYFEIYNSKDLDEIVF